MPKKTLSGASRSHLDDIVQHMEAAGEPATAIQTVVEDFKQKYSADPPVQTETDDPSTAYWNSIKKTAGNVGRAALDALPAIGAIGGGIAAAPLAAATLNPITAAGVDIAGAGLGAGIGRGARDIIGEYTGLEPKTTPGSKAMRIGVDTATGAATQAVVPGLIAAAKSPVKTGVELGSRLKNVVPPKVREFLPDVQELFQSGITPPKVGGQRVSMDPIVERYPPSGGGAPAVKPASIEEAMIKPLPGASARDAASMQTIAAHPGAYGEGGIMPSGMTPTELQGMGGEPPPSSVEQAAMNRTGIDSSQTVTDKYRENEILNRHAQLDRSPRTATERHGPDVQPTANMEVAPHGDEATPIEDAIASRQLGAPRPITLKPESMTPLQWKENLAMYGADKLSQLTGLLRSEVIQRAGSVAGHLPLEAESQMMDMGGPR